MRMNDILTQQQLNEEHMLQEAPLGSLVRAAGRGVGKAVGGVAKGVGAVAGGIAGIGGALKKGFQTGKAIVGDTPDPNAGQPGYTPSAAGGTATPPAAGGTAGGTATPPAAGGTAGGAATPPAAGGTAGGAATPPAAGGAATPPAAGGTATPPAAGGTAGGAAPKAAGGTATPPAAGGTAGGAAPKAAGGAATPPAAGGTAGGAAPKAADADSKSDPAYVKAQKAVDALPPEQKKEIIGLLQADPKVKAAMVAKPSTQGKKGVSQPGKPTFTGVPEKPATAPEAGGAAFGQMAQQLAGGKPPNTMANAPVSASNTAKPGNPNAAAPTASKGAFTNVAQQLAKPAGRPQGGGKVAGAAPSQTPGAVKKRAARAAAKQPAAVTASLVHHGKSLNEVLAQRLELHKRKMFETQLCQGTASVFVK